MIQLKSTDSLQVLLAGAITTSQGVLYAAFADIATDGSTFAPSPSSGTTNSTTAVDWVAAPATGLRRVVKYLSLYNADTVSMTATVRVVDNGTNRILLKAALLTGERLEYNADSGFRVVSASGAVAATVSDGDKGDITVTSAGATWTVDNDVITNAKLANMATATIKGRTTAGTGDPEDLTAAQVRALLGIGVQSVVSAATVTPTYADDLVEVTAQAAALALANPTGTAVDGWGIAIRVKDNGTARAISYGSEYRAVGVTLPTTTVISKWLYLGMIRNSGASKWDVVSVSQET